ncbi:putative C6 transcription factor Prf [Aspergillus niger CBS 101883]|uniref:putative C6 transcription factor Prf n=1 Tax=Aspergillus lacticoffeatus (strain CBS 101883) TaxID=1450533 RepID=UPI000D7FAEA5|nr:uncharacterized protein BO96DRAFT_390096 [Aspergillus niger CBS 101883]PYH58087.1 hypothetical protein BO96DRAFT_390096 [Aspergillus niger CBS 101883]
MADNANRLTQQTQASPSQPQLNAAYEEAASIAIEHHNTSSDYIPRPKRIACVLCRRRKLRCDGNKPSCGRCSRLGHECIFDEVRKKSGPKRGYVKQLEARLAQVETLLKSQGAQVQQSQGNSPIALPSINSTGVPDTSPQDDVHMSSPEGETDPTYSTPASNHAGTASANEPEGRLIGLGLEEPLPTQEVIDELTTIYFEKIHLRLPMIHRPRYLAASSLAPASRPPICLQYIMWCHAASVTNKYASLHSIFYQRARKYAELDELEGLGERALSTAHCQTWVLIGTYEFKMMFLPRAWLSVGKAVRLATMLGLNGIDEEGLNVKQTLPPPKDWSEREERRRVFWMAFCLDRYASVGTGWPVSFDERDIFTNLPASEESFIGNEPQQTGRLADVLVTGNIATMSTFAGIVILACMFGKNVAHLHRPDPQDNDHDLNGRYWQRHRAFDNLLLHFALSMPSHLRLTVLTTDPNIIFCNMAVHTATICLHQGAIFKAEKNRMPEQIATESKRRCILAADQISNIMKMISHLDLSVVSYSITSIRLHCANTKQMDPFMAFCIYVAARVFIQYLKFRPNDSAARSSLQFAFSALDVLKQKNPLAESFVIQLEFDIGGTAFGDVRTPKRMCFASHIPHTMAGASNPQNANQPRVQADNLIPDHHQSTPGPTPTAHAYQQTTTEMPPGRPSTTIQNGTNTSNHAAPTRKGNPISNLDTHMPPTSNDNANTNQSTNTIPSQLASTLNNLNMGPTTYPSSAQAPIQPDVFYPNVFAPFQYEADTSFPNQPTQLDPTRSENPLTTDSAWTTSENPIPDLSDENLVNNPPNGPEALSDAQWALLASGAWKSWQGLNFMS